MPHQNKNIRGALQPNNHEELRVYTSVPHLPLYLKENISLVVSVVEVRALQVERYDFQLRQPRHCYLAGGLGHFPEALKVRHTEACIGYRGKLDRTPS
ncbi:MAG: hypothetical protein Q8M99_02670 [Methylotenera sp.]|nr:hypothetical protein [Methylotenera sp.]